MERNFDLHCGGPMIFQATRLNGVWLVLGEPAHDERGFFVRTMCVREFATHGLVSNFVQHSVSHSVRRGTLRGMHFQSAPHEESKLVRCIRGAIFDVLIDIRPESSTYLQWESYELDDRQHRQLYVPPGVAHGFQTLSDDVMVNYLISGFYEPSAARGVRYNDEAFGIRWPLEISAISGKDSTWPDFDANAARPG